MPVCSTVKAKPATTNVAVRGWLVGFAVRTYFNVWLPEPSTGGRIVIQEFVLLTDHVQTAPAVTVTVPVCAMEVCKRCDGVMA